MYIYLHYAKPRPIENIIFCFSYFYNPTSSPNALMCIYLYIIWSSNAFFDEIILYNFIYFTFRISFYEIYLYFLYDPFYLYIYRYIYCHDVDVYRNTLYVPYIRIILASWTATTVDHHNIITSVYIYYIYIRLDL